jgi:hypothetical protein
MEEIIDRVVAELNAIKDLDYADGGFKDEIDLADDIWWGDPGLLPQQNYPFITVFPETSSPASETTGTIHRDNRIVIALILDPREYYDETEITETSGSREIVRTMTAIEKHFERTSLRRPGGLASGSREVTVGVTEYAPPMRGALFARAAQLTLIVPAQRPRLP